jgi:TrmH family RNA methyltransferase
MEITSKNNTFIKELIKEKAKNRFLLFLDTPNLVKEGFENNLEPKHILIEIGKSFDFVPQKYFEKIIFVSNHILQQISDVKAFAGIIGVFSFAKKQFENPKNDYLVLDNVQEAGNVGTLLRSALGAGFKNVYLLDCASVTNPKVIRASAGAIFKLNIYELTKQEFLQEFKASNLFVADLQGKNVFTTDFVRPIGVALGNEGQGISKEIELLAKENKLTLPMDNGLESLNVAVSGSIIMYEIKYRRK